MTIDLPECTTKDNGIISLSKDVPISTIQDMTMVLQVLVRLIGIDIILLINDEGIEDYFVCCFVHDLVIEQF